MKSNKSHRMSNLKCYHNRRKALIQQLGGKCALCGSTENLEFDHIDSASKEFDLSKCLTQNIDVVLNELSKCQLLCEHCHIEKTKNEHDNNSKINKQLAIEICNEYINSKTTQSEIGQKYGISQRTVSSIIHGERWADETSTIDRSMLVTKQEISVDMIDPISGNIIRTYKSMAEAMKDGHASSHISDCCNGKKKTHHGYIWKKHEE